MTSKLERYLSKELYTRFGHLSIRQNYRPGWMEGLELDFYIEELGIAAEVQGNQHYSFIEFFHKNSDGFEKQQDRDYKKVSICREKKIKLVEIFTEKDADLFIKEISESVSPPKYFYRDDTKKKKKNKLNYSDIYALRKNIEIQKSRVLLALEEENEKDVMRFYLALKASVKTLMNAKALVEQKEILELDEIQKACKNFLEKKGTK